MISGHGGKDIRETIKNLIGENGIVNLVRLMGCYTIVPMT